jgi:hypothetical protein
MMPAAESGFVHSSRGAKRIHPKVSAHRLDGHIAGAWVARRNRWDLEVMRRSETSRRMPGARAAYHVHSYPVRRLTLTPAAGLDDDRMDSTASQSRRIVAITGAGTGIGRAAARAFAAEGAHVVAIGRRAEPSWAAVRARNIRYLLAAGLTLDDVRVFLPCLESDMVAAPPSDKGLRVVTERLAVLNERIAAQTRVRDRLEAALREKTGGPNHPAAP